MNILSINFLNTPQYLNKKATKENYGNYFGLKMALPLKEDCVSFGKAKLKDAILIKRSNRLEHAGLVFLDILSAIADKLKDRGVSFVREYSAINLLKSDDSCRSKIARQCTTDIKDPIRGTLFVKNITDMELLKDILDAFEARGLALSKASMSIDELIKRGYIPKKNDKNFIDVPDLDIRLAEGHEGIVHLPNELRYSFGKPQKSGYEDIQLRLYNPYINKSPLMRELIILTGENYAIAKHIEYEHVYKIVRKFDELSLLKTSDENNEQIKLIKRYITLVKQLCSTEISQKLFENAKNKDVYNIEENIIINVSEKDINTLKDYFNQIRENINGYYTNAKKSVSDKKDKMRLGKELKSTLEKINIIETELIASCRKINKGKVPQTMEELLEILRIEKEAKKK